MPMHCLWIVPTHISANNTAFILEILTAISRSTEHGC